MIEAKTTGDLSSALTDKARALAKSRGENAVRQIRNDPERWRKARLLWPLFVEQD